MLYLPFAGWRDILAHVRAGHPIAYHAPLDPSPRWVGALARGERIRILVPQGERFWADRSHLDRFRRKGDPQMYSAQITRLIGPPIELGPTDTRDEASRLARAWMASHPSDSRNPIYSVRIERTETTEADASEGGES